MIKLWRFILLVLVSSIVIGVSFVFLPSKIEYFENEKFDSIQQGHKDYDLSLMNNWYNAINLTEDDVQGRPVLVFFFNFTELESINALKYVEDWYQKYSDDGLVVIGVHSPILEFESQQFHLESGIDEFGITFPVTRDYQWRNWNRYGVKGLPAWNLYDQTGKLEFQAFGALNYGQLQTRIAHSVRRHQKFLPFDIKPPPLYVQPLARSVKSLYAGFKNNSLGQIVSEQETNADGNVIFREPIEKQRDKIYLNGQWTLTDNTLTPASMEGSPYVAVSYSLAKKVFATMEVRGGKNSIAYVTLDDKPIPKSIAGEHIIYDSQGQSFVQIYQPRIYSLVDSFDEQEHVLKIYPQIENWDLYNVTLEP